ncbi:hypothetical protein Tco_1277012 [Tanacetum coccineum]
MPCLVGTSDVLAWAMLECPGIVRGDLVQQYKTDKGKADEIVVKISKRCDEHLLQVIVGKFGESVEVFKLNDTAQEWEKIDGLGKHMIFVCSPSSFCIEAKVPEMENKLSTFQDSLRKMGIWFSIH